MDIDLNDIDPSQIPGYTPITNSTPIWKRDMIEKKNNEKIEEYIRDLQRKKAEEDKWKHVPAWKRKLMEEKEKAKEQETIERQQQAEEEARRKKNQEAEEKKREQLRRQQEREREMEEELKNIPAWKREIMMKRGGEIKNWGDEREEINADQE